MSVSSIAASARISECFLSIQGEGPSVGHPAHFIRLQGCSVGCHWCDTKYTWPADGGRRFQFDALEQRLCELGAANLLVVTGGEPLENPAFPDIMDWAARRWQRIEVETSGIREFPTVPRNVTWNWSPKLSSVTARADETWAHVAALLEFHQYICKVVVSSEEDWEELLARVQEVGIPREHVYVMPEGIRAEQLRDRAQWLVPLVINQGFRLSTRLHIGIWGARRGV